MLLLAALQLNILKRAKNHHFPNTEINNRVGDGTYTTQLRQCLFPDTPTEGRGKREECWIGSGSSGSAALFLFQLLPHSYYLLLYDP